MNCDDLREDYATYVRPSSAAGGRRVDLRNFVRGSTELGTKFYATSYVVLRKFVRGTWYVILGNFVCSSTELPGTKDQLLKAFKSRL